MTRPIIPPSPPKVCASCQKSSPTCVKIMTANRRGVYWACAICRANKLAAEAPRAG